MEYIIIQAGGKGTRLGYLTRNKPKALVPVDNLPMIFHLFRKYPDKRFVVIADYHKEVLREYLSCFAPVKYQVVDAVGTGTCSGIRQALKRIPPKEPFMLVWSDLILPEGLKLPKGYGEPPNPEQTIKSDAFPQAGQTLDMGLTGIETGTETETEGQDESDLSDRIGIAEDYIGISQTFCCRWSYQNGTFLEERSTEHGVAGFFLFGDKRRLSQVPESGELVRWMQEQNFKFQEIGLAGTREFGILEEYEKLEQEKCRPFNRITVENGVLIKEAVDEQGRKLAVRERAWYEKAKELGIPILPQIYETNPLKMEYIKGKNIYECQLSHEEKAAILDKLVQALHQLHQSGKKPADSFSMREAYYHKTMERLSKIKDLVPFAKEQYIRINGKNCRNVYFYKRDLEKKLEQMVCDEFCMIHGDCTFSNLMLREDGTPVLIDPRGYFGFTELYGDVRYDWAKLYYSIAGNYDRFNLKDFRLEIGEKEVSLSIGSNHWEDMEPEFFQMTGAKEEEIKLLHGVIWLSLTTYAWQDYDSICGAFYNGLYYLEDVL